MKHPLSPHVRKDILSRWFAIRQHDADRSEELQQRQQQSQPPSKEHEHWLNAFFHSWRP